MSENIYFLFEVPSGKGVQLEPFHYAIIGQTQFSGKTTLIKRLADWAASQGFTVLVFDTKETEADYEGFGKEVPVVLRETTDSFVLIGLLESMFKRKLTPYYATLSRLTEAAKGFDDIIKRAKEMEASTRSSWLKDACRVLYDLLERLKSETSKVETVQQLKLYPGINRMPINEFSLEAQQLIVKNAFEDALRFYKRKLILVIDEAFKFLPQGYSSAATRAVMNVITQGAKTGLYVWIATQFLAVTDKDPLKACAVKFLGTQDHITEVKHTLDLIPEARGKFSTDDIMKLKLGHWILVRKRPPFVGIVYSLPLNVPEDVGVKVAKGELTPEYVRDKYLKPRLVEEEDEMYKQLYEQERKKREELEKQLANIQKELQGKVEQARQEAYRDAMQKLEELKRQWNIEEYQKTIMMLKDEKATLEAELKKLEPLKALREAFIKAFGVLTAPGSEPGQLEVEHKGLVVKVYHAGDKVVKVSTDSVVGQILYCAVKYFRDREFATGELNEKLLEHGWNVKPSTLSAKLSLLVNEGKLIKTDKGYRLPSIVHFLVD
jgi:hypothetical protein